MGPFVVVEGIDGSGKSSIAREVASYLGGRLMSFPDRSTFFGRIIDSWLSGNWCVDAAEAVRTHAHQRVPSFDAELIEPAVFQALQTVNRLEVLPKLLAARNFGPLVVDRYWQSGYAYGAADGLDPTLVQMLHASLPQPDLCILVDCPLPLARERILLRGGAKADRYERSDPAYFQKVFDNYSNLWGEHVLDEQPRWVCVENQGTLESAVKQALHAISQLSTRR